jgi:hypothetical protein
MEKFIQNEVKKLIKEYAKSKDQLVLDELNQFISHIPNLLTVRIR